MEVIADPITVNCRKVLAGLKLIGADYTLTRVDYFAGEQKSPKIVAINPNAAIPVLRDGDLILWGIERDAAVRRRQGGQCERLPYRPADQGRRKPLAPVGMRHLGSPPATFISWRTASSRCWAISRTRRCSTARRRLPQACRILDTRLGESAYICGDQPTIADVAVAAPMHPPRLGEAAA